LVSHHIDFIKEVSHRAVWIDQGRIVMDGDPEEICDALIKKSNAKYLKNFNIEKLMQD
jgi:methyl coenzyme M reductase system subunit A2